MKVLQPWELEENNMNTFLFKLESAVQKRLDPFRGLHPCAGEQIVFVGQTTGGDHIGT